MTRRVEDGCVVWKKKKAEMDKNHKANGDQ